MTVNEDLLLYTIETGKPVFRIYEPERIEIVMGAGCKESNLKEENINRDSIPVLRRKGGGGTVVLSPGQVVVALSKVVESRFNNLEYMKSINSWIVDALSFIGVRGIEERGISDLAIGGKKVLGASLHRKRRILFYQSSLLVENDISLFSLYLKHPPREPDYRAGRSHGEFCTTLREAGFNVTTDDVIEILRAVVGDKLPLL